MALETKVRRVSVVAAGRCFLLHHLSKLKFVNETKKGEKKVDSVENEGKGKENGKGNGNENGSKFGKKNKKWKKNKTEDIEVTIDWDCDLDDYYGLLGIKSYAMNITQDNLKKAYRKVSLLCHPDKVDESHRVQAEQRFKLLQIAFETLSDSYQKLLYDSKIEFDSSIPTNDMIMTRLYSQSNDKIELTKQEIEFEKQYGTLDEIKNNEEIWDIESDFYVEDRFLRENIFEKSGNNDNNDSNIEFSIETRFEYFKKIILNGNELKFYKLFQPYFDKFSIYSKKKPVPKLGNENTNANLVRKFYNFWFEFDSWKSFLHIVEENDIIYNIKDAENNKERKWMIKENERLQSHLKKNESILIYNLVKMAYLNDPRVIRFIIMDKFNEISKLKEIEMLNLEKQKEFEEKELALHIAKEKEKERIEKEKRKQRQLLEQERLDAIQVPLNFRKFCIENDYFVENKNKRVTNENIDLICFNCNVSDIKEILNNKNDSLAAYSIFLNKLEIANANKKEKEKMLEIKKREKEEKERLIGGESKDAWSMDEISLLWNGISRFPGGTIDRWTKITRLFNGKRSEKEVIQKVKQLSKKQRSNVKNKSRNNGDDNKDKKKNKDKEKDKDKEKEKEKNEDESNWTVQEQKALEQALRQVQSLPANQRWDKVAQIVGNKTKDQCIQRFKYIRAQLMAKQKQQSKK